MAANLPSPSPSLSKTNRDLLFNSVQKPFPLSLQNSVPKSFTAETLFNFRELYRRTFPEGNTIERSSTRYIHPKGAIAKVTWTPSSSSYNGIFKTSLSGVIRLGYSSQGYGPLYNENSILGFGLKLFPNSPPPVGTTPGKTGTLDTEFIEVNYNNPDHDFDHIFKTNIEMNYIPNIFYYVGIQVGKQAFALATDKEPIHLSLTHFATNGPKILYADFAHKDLSKIKNLDQLKAGDLLFTFYDADPTITSGAQILGTLTLDEPFILKNPYADQFLAFDHNLNDQPRSPLLKFLPIRLGYYGYTAVKSSIQYILGKRDMLN
jgi:hypothetical protein